MISFLSFVAELARDRGLRLIAICQFIVMVAVGTALSGCAGSNASTNVAAPVPTVFQTTDADGTVTRFETSPQGISVSTWKSGSSRTNSSPPPATRLMHDSNNFSRASLTGDLVTNEFTTGK